MRTYRFWFFGCGLYIDITKVNSEEEARAVWGKSQLVTLSDGKHTFVCVSLHSVSKVEDITDKY